ncbi:MAG: hypothetical protein E5V90_02050 [Mesorhizobium sp.]|nr:MAG: hypothetical protein E5V90_02050 [Mesorhizobium sp.]
MKFAVVARAERYHVLSAKNASRAGRDLHYMVSFNIRDTVTLPETFAIRTQPNTDLTSVAVCRLHQIANRPAFDISTHALLYGWRGTFISA